MKKREKCEAELINLRSMAASLMASGKAITCALEKRIDCLQDKLQEMAMDKYSFAVTDNPTYVNNVMGIDF